MKIDRMLSLLLAALLVLPLASCGKPEEAASSAASSMPDEPSVSAIAPVEPEPEPEPALPYVNPLTGEGCETDIGQNRPIAIMLNNRKKAMPQLGVSQADIIYEMPAEGGITRMMGVFQSVEGVGEIGTVRSARDYYVSLAFGHDAIYLHAGGSPQAYDAIQNWGVTALDCVNGPYEGTLFWRDPDRRKNAGLEHSVLTSGDKILELLPTYKKVTLEHKDGFDLGWTFAEGAGTPAAAISKLTVPFSSYKTGVFTWDETRQKFLVEEYGAPYTDGNTGEQVAATNVLVLLTDVSAIQGDDKGRQSVRTTGEGSGYLAKEGQLFEITWKRADKTDCLSFYDASGNLMPLAVGNSYINIVSQKTNVTWE